ncbi:primase homolog protein-like [Pistacia vera]|uniref:primase homolog protein-like n=1 Tax=Pistacia vera TaxID=55513 RepID=UPI0012637CF2|nr:primase homolog protein-like [Pistacia vera]
MPFGIIHRCYFSFPTLPKGRLNPVWSRQAHVPDSNNNTKVFSLKQMTEKSLGLEPLGDKLIAYFAERMISEGTLRRNSVMQLSGVQAVMAFPCRQNGVLVGCKYQTCREKKIWQERGTEKWLFGFDDIKEAAEINC